MVELRSKSPGHQKFLEKQQERLDLLQEQFNTRYKDTTSITLEIGCGHGHYLTAYGEAHPHETCLGIDIVTKRIHKACQKRDKRNLDNLHFLKAEVRELFMAWPERIKLGRIFILFPDPWPKKRHIKNRIIQPVLLETMASLSDAGTPLHFRTDDRKNFRYGEEVIGEHPKWEINEGLPWPFESPSYFQDLLGAQFSLSATRVS